MTIDKLQDSSCHCSIQAHAHPRNVSRKRRRLRGALAGGTLDAVTGGVGVVSATAGASVMLPASDTFDISDCSVVVD